MAALIPLLSTGAGLVLSLRLQSRPGAPTSAAGAREPRARFLQLVGGLLGATDSLAVVAGGLWLVWNGLQKTLGEPPANPLPWETVLTAMTVGWFLSILSFWVTDQAQTTGAAATGEQSEKPHP